MLQVQHSLAPACPLFVAHAGWSGAFTTRLRLAHLNNSRGTPAIQNDTVTPLKLQQPQPAASDIHASLPGLPRHSYSYKLGQAPGLSEPGGVLSTARLSHPLTGFLASIGRAKSSSYCPL